MWLARVKSQAHMTNKGGVMGGAETKKHENKKKGITRKAHLIGYVSQQGGFQNAH